MPDHREETKIEHHHSQRRNQQVAGKEDLNRIHPDERQCLNRGALHARRPGEDPHTEQDFQTSDGFRRGARQSVAEHSPDDQLVPRDTVENFAVEPMEDPNAADDNLAEDVE